MPQTSYGQTYAFDAGPGVGMQDLLTGAPNAGAGLVFPEYGAPAATVAGIVGPQDEAAKPKTNYLWYILAVLGLLVIMKFAGEHEKSAMQPSFMGIGFYNFLASGIMASLFIIVFKTLANMYPVKGVTDLANVI